MGFSDMIVILLMVTMFYDVTPHPASCTEDTQCFSGFYCDESAHTCRECLRCDQLQREPPVRQLADFCVKTVVQCGPCLEGYDNGSAECAASDASAPHAYLPAYGWAAVALGLVLMIITLAVFLKTKTFRLFDYSSRTSVQSVHAAGPAALCRPLAPPPYNHILPSAFAPSSPHLDAPEIQRLVADAPEPRKHLLPEEPPARAREAAGSQAARVYSHPAYVRVPQTLDSFKTPVVASSPPVDDESGDVMSSPGLDVTAVELSGPNSKLEGNFNATNVPEDNTNYEDIAFGRGKDQDSNNNGSSAEGSRGPGAQRGACVIGGPSFVINVVENISHVAHFTRCDSS